MASLTREQAETLEAWAEHCDAKAVEATRKRTPSRPANAELAEHWQFAAAMARLYVRQNA